MTPAALLGELAALDADAGRALEPITARARVLRIAAEGMFDAALHAPPAERPPSSGTGGTRGWRCTPCGEGAPDDGQDLHRLPASGSPGDRPPR